mmetsp:Transcript_20852/g.41916  ORF Transcript_20852/g.41916 Transcript_20852/m.41916 type:complete len:200 (-) Transcript_20852:93-692(-)
MCSSSSVCSSSNHKRSRNNCSSSSSTNGSSRSRSSSSGSRRNSSSRCVICDNCRSCTSRLSKGAISSSSSRKCNVHKGIYAPHLSPRAVQGRRWPRRRSRQTARRAAKTLPKRFPPQTPLIPLGALVLCQKPAWALRVSQGPARRQPHRRAWSARAACSPWFPRPRQVRSVPAITSRPRARGLLPPSPQPLPGAAAGHP